MKKNLLLSLCSAILLILSFPNFNFPFLIWFALAPFFFLLDGKSPKVAFFWGLATGYVFFLGTHYWLIHVTLPGMLLVNLYLGIYFAVFALGYAYFNSKIQSTVSRLIILPSLWVVCEFARDRLFTGFGWACLGHSQYQTLPVIQIADITGVFGVSFVIVMVNVFLKRCLEFPLASPFKKEGENNLGAAAPFLAKKQGRDWAIAFSFIVLVLGGVLGYGYVQLHQQISKSEMNLQVVVVQPNIPQSRKWEPQSWEAIGQKILRLTQQRLQSSTSRLVIWPETSFPGYLWQSPQRYDEIKRFVVQNDIELLFGAVTRRQSDFYNSAILLSNKGEEIGQYNKMHLVPFGEFLPLRPLLNFVENFVPIGDFTRGKEFKVFPLGFSVLICFEDTVAPVVRSMTLNGAQFLVNITNDGWFQDTNAPFLHLAGSVFQSVANRRCMIRAANTGVSAWIDQHGQIRAQIKDHNGKMVMIEGVEVFGLIKTNKNLTFYTRFGDVFALLCLSFVGIGLIKRKF